MKENDSIPTPLVPMPMPQQGHDNGICVEYSREDGFRAYLPGQKGKQPAKDNVWEAYLGGSLRNKELDMFQSRLAQFTPQGRENCEICNFLYKSLLEFWGQNLALREDNSHLNATSAWETYVCNCCNDLDVWIRDREYEVVWDDWEDCLYALRFEWLAGAMLFTYIPPAGNAEHDGRNGKTKLCRKWHSLLRLGYRAIGIK